MFQYYYEIYTKYIKMRLNNETEKKRLYDSFDITKIPLLYY